MQRLNARQREFVRHYVSGADGVRGNATQSAIAAGYAAKHAHVNGPALMANHNIKAAVIEAHRRADAAAIARLRDWKTLAPEAQDRLLALARGKIPVNVDPAAGNPMHDRDDAAVAAIIRDANMEILERAYPKKLRIEGVDPRAELAALLGIAVEELPEEVE